MSHLTADSERDETTDSPEGLQAAKAPIGTGILPILGLVWSLVLLALGVVALHDSLVYAGAVSDSLWLEDAVSWADNRAAADWMVVVGVLAALVGLWLLLIALRPRPRNEVALRARTGVFLTTTGLRRLVTSTCSDVDGVDTVSVSASRTRVRVSAAALSGQADETRGRIDEAVNTRLAALENPPAVRVQVKTSGGTV